MALFNSPETPGPGVSKNAPKKRSFFAFFELFKRYYGKLVGAGLLKLLFNLLVIPAGLGAIGAARISRAAARDRHSFKTDFRDAVKKNWGQALFMGIINNLLTAATLFSVYYLFQENNVNKNADIVSFLMLSVSVASFIVVTFIRFYTPSVLLMFNVTIGQLYKNAFLLAFGGWKRNFLIFTGHFLMYAVIFCPMLLHPYIGLGIAVCLYILIAPPFSALLIQYNIFPVMMKYLIEPFMRDHPGEGENTLRELGLIQSDEEAVMKDSEKD